MSSSSAAADGNGRFVPHGVPRVTTAKTPRAAAQTATPAAPRHNVQGRREARQKKTVNRTKVGGGFNPSVNPTLNISLGGGGQATQAATAAATSAKGTPGGDFMSNEDIHAWSESIRKDGRRRAVERALDAEHLESVLRHIPDSTGSAAGAWMRARRVSRHAKKIARAEQAIAKAAAQMYAQFQREYEAELRKVSAGRPAQQRTRFQF